MVFLKLGGVREVKDILRNFALGISKEQLINMYNYATDEKLDCLLLDLEADKHKKFRHNFDEYMNPDDYGEPEDK
jgi:hypothetical protein